MPSAAPSAGRQVEACRQRPPAPAPQALPYVTPRQKSPAPAARQRAAGRVGAAPCEKVRQPLMVLHVEHRRYGCQDIRCRDSVPPRQGDTAPQQDGERLPCETRNR